MDTPDAASDAPDAHGHATSEDVEHLAAERDALRAELDHLKRPRTHRLRRVVAACLVVISCLLVVLSTTVVWVHRTVLDTNTFVATVGPVFKDHGVDSVVASEVTTTLFTQLDLQSRLAHALPPKASFVAGPMTTAVEGFVAGELSKVLGSSEFQRAWTSTLRTTHEQLVAVLRGQRSQLISTANGYIVLNTVPVINLALSHISALVGELTGRHLTLPTITSADLPKEAIDKLSKSLGITLPTNFGQIQVVKTGDLRTVQRGVSAFDNLALLLPIAAILGIALALWVSASRRRTLLQLSILTIVLLVVQRRVTVHEQGVYAAKALNPAVAQSVVSQLLAGYFALSSWVIATMAVVTVVALLTGPYRWATSVRTWVVRWWRRAAAANTAQRRRVVIAWAAAHAEGLQIGVAVAAVVLFFLVSVSWLSFFAIGVLVAGFELWFQHLKGTTAPASGAVAGDRNEVGDGRDGRGPPSVTSPEPTASAPTP